MEFTLNEGIYIYEIIIKFSSDNSTSIFGNVLQIVSIEDDRVNTKIYSPLTYESGDFVFYDSDSYNATFLKSMNVSDVLDDDFIGKEILEYLNGVTAEQYNIYLSDISNSNLVIDTLFKRLYEQNNKDIMSEMLKQIDKNNRLKEVLNYGSYFEINYPINFSDD